MLYSKLCESKKPHRQLTTHLCQPHLKRDESGKLYELKIALIHSEDRATVSSGPLAKGRGAVGGGAMATS